jgi:hypothetical protein
MIRRALRVVRRLVELTLRRPAAVPVGLPVGMSRSYSLSELDQGDEKFVVFFAPEAGVVQHYISHCVVAKSLEERGHRTLIVRCFDVYPRCIVMDANSLPLEPSAEQRSEICASCRRHSTDMTGAYGLNVIELTDLVDDGARRVVDLLTADLPDDLSTFEIEGHRLGQICGAEAAVALKTTDFTGATPEVRGLLIKYLRGALLSYFAMKRLAATGKVARVVHYNEYAILLAAALAARGGAVATTFMTTASIRAVDRRRIVFMPDPLAILGHRKRLHDWVRWRELNLTPEDIGEVADDCLYRIAGNSVMVYSPARTGSTDDVFGRLALSPQRRTIVAFTSSLDEIAANNQYLAALNCEPFSERQPFRDQIEWLEALIEKVEPSPGLQLIIRIHPREGANRREAVVSSHLGLLKARFSGSYEHVRVVWPGDDVSSYDLMELADVGLSSWSSTALEMARFGVPAMIAFDKHTPFPIGDVVRWAEKPEDYFRILDELLQRAPSLETIRFAFRWTYLRTLGSSLDLGDVIPVSDCSTLPPFVSPKAGSDIEDVLIYGRTAIEINQERIFTQQNAESPRVENDALLRQLRRMIWFMCTGQDRAKDYRLCYCEAATATVPSGYDAVMVVNGQFVEFRTRDMVIRRRSRMVQRLGILAATTVDCFALA